MGSLEVRNLIRIFLKSANLILTRILLKNRIQPFLYSRILIWVFLQGRTRIQVVFQGSVPNPSCFSWIGSESGLSTRLFRDPDRIRINSNRVRLTGTREPRFQKLSPYEYSLQKKEKERERERLKAQEKEREGRNYLSLETLILKKNEYLTSFLLNISLFFFLSLSGI